MHQKIAVGIHAGRGPAAVTAQRLTRTGKLIAAETRSKGKITVAAYAVCHRARPCVHALNGIVRIVCVTRDPIAYGQIVNSKGVLLASGKIIGATRAASEDLPDRMPWPTEVGFGKSK